MSMPIEEPSENPDLNSNGDGAEQPKPKVIKPLSERNAEIAGQKFKEIAEDLLLINRRIDKHMEGVHAVLQRLESLEQQVRVLAAQRIGTGPTA